MGDVYCTRKNCAQNKEVKRGEREVIFVCMSANVQIDKHGQCVSFSQRKKE